MAARMSLNSQIGVFGYNLILDTKNQNNNTILGSQNINFRYKCLKFIIDLITIYIEIAHLAVKDG